MNAAAACTAAPSAPAAPAAPAPCAPVPRRPLAAYLVNRPRTPKFERPVSDMAHEMLVRVIGGLGTAIVLDGRDREVLYHYLYGRSCEQVAAQLGLRETSVHKHLHRVFLRTGIETRRGLLELGRELATSREFVRMPRPRSAAA